jgi:hypothetical protein
VLVDELGGVVDPNVLDVFVVVVLLVVVLLVVVLVEDCVLFGEVFDGVVVLAALVV